MSRPRLPLLGVLLALVVVATGCSGERAIAVSSDGDGGVVVFSVCRNQPLYDVHVSPVGEPLVAFPGDGADPVVVPAESLPDSGRAPATIAGGYDDAFAIGVTVDPAELDPGTVVVSGRDGGVEDRGDFLADRHSCGTPPYVVWGLLGLLVFVAAAFVGVPVAAVVWWWRRRRVSPAPGVPRNR